MRDDKDVGLNWVKVLGSHDQHEQKVEDRTEVDIFESLRQLRNRHKEHMEETAPGTDFNTATINWITSAIGLIGLAISEKKIEDPELVERFKKYEDKWVSYGENRVIHVATPEEIEEMDSLIGKFTGEETIKP